MEDWVFSDLSRVGANSTGDSRGSARNMYILILYLSCLATVFEYEPVLITDYHYYPGIQ